MKFILTCCSRKKVLSVHVKQASQQCIFGRGLQRCLIAAHQRFQDPRIIPNEPIMAKPSPPISRHTDQAW